MEIRAIDVSSVQGKPDWTRVSESGIQSAILRVHQKYGIDSSFEHNYQGCKDNGILVGVYKYSYAMTVQQAREEADAVLAVLNGRGLDFPVFYDLERIKAAGYIPAIYCNWTGITMFWTCLACPMTIGWRLIQRSIQA